MKQDYTPLCQALGYDFQQPEHLITALTHRSAGTPNNERLEFLGDALLSFIVAEVLFERFPGASEGQLTRLRANLVKGDTLAEVAQMLCLGQYLHLGGGELKSGGWRRTSILSDAFEALIGAVYLDGGMTTCEQVVLQLFQPHLNMLSLQTIHKDPKTRLQELLQSQQQELPNYRVLTVTGEPHAQYFEVECYVPGLQEPTCGTGNTRRRAEQDAAEKALQFLSQA